MSINKKNVFDPAQARYLRKTRREEGLSSSSSSSSSSPDPYLEKKAENLRNESIKSQIDYYGYVLEPFNMKNERGVGKLDDEGFYVFDHKKENEARDAWLDSLDQDPYHQGLAQNEENRLKALKGVWDEGSGPGIQKKAEGGSLLEEEEEEGKEGEKEGEKMEEDEEEIKKDEILNREQLILLVEELIGFMKEEELTSGLIKRMRPKEKKMQVFKKNIRKGVRKDEEGEKKKEKEEEKKKKEEEDQEKKDFLRVVEICDLLINNGFMEIYEKNKQELLFYVKNSELKEENFYNMGNEPISSEDEIEEDDGKDKEEGKRKITEQQEIEEKKKIKELNIITEVEEMVRNEKKEGNNPNRKDSDDIF